MSLGRCCLLSDSTANERPRESGRPARGQLGVGTLITSAGLEQRSWGGPSSSRDLRELSSGRSWGWVCFLTENSRLGGIRVPAHSGHTVTPTIISLCCHIFLCTLGHYLHAMPFLRSPPSVCTVKPAVPCLDHPSLLTLRILPPLHVSGQGPLLVWPVGWGTSSGPPDPAQPSCLVL